MLIFRSRFPENIFRVKYIWLINVFYPEDVLWKVKTKYYNFNQILHLLILFKMPIKLLVILFIIKLYAQNNALPQFRV